MIYASLQDLQERTQTNLEHLEDKCMAMLEDAAVIIDAYNSRASLDAKKLVTCNMILRAIGNGEEGQVPIGTTQGTVSALGYSQTWTMGGGSTGEMYLSKMDKKLLGVSNRIGYTNPYLCCEE